MDDKFRKLKNKSADDLFRLQGLTRFDLGTHARTKLRMAGCAGSKTLLHLKEAKAHGKRLAERFNKHWQSAGKNGAVGERLRMVTVLDSVTALDVGEIMRCVTAMETRIYEWLYGKRVFLAAAVEVEVVNIGFLEKVNAQGTVEKRKLAVLKKMTNETGSAALIHFHGIIDAMDIGVDALAESARRIWTGSYHVELETTYMRRSVVTNAAKICAYATKGGNDFLRYKTGFGRETEGDFDAKIWREGMGRADMGGETVTDERGLTLGEIRVLDAAYSAIQKRKRGMRGHEIIKSISLR